MAEFDEKLNSILSNPDAMSQIMQLAQSLGGGSGASQETPPPAPPAPQPPPPAAAQGGGDLFSSLSSLAGGLDPKLLTRLRLSRSLAASGTTTPASCFTPCAPI